MPVTVVGSFKDSQALTLTLVAEFDAGVERVWRIWEDPRQLERWWGPPNWPATFERHDFVVGGRSTYYLTGVDGQRVRGFWMMTAIEPPHRLEFDDGYADDPGGPAAPMEPIHIVVTLEAMGSRTRMTTVAKFATAEQLERAIEMGVEGGVRASIGQIDGLLADASR